jgi:hypothetical protein
LTQAAVFIVFSASPGISFRAGTLQGVCNGSSCRRVV